MKTMLQDENNDYDIDDGAYFQKGVLVGDRGAEMSSLDARKMVRNAMDDGSFKTPPEVKGNCVRVHYSEGYHVDIPVYRRIVDEEADETYYELASSSGWKRSDARDVTKWYEETRKGTSDARQFRRLNRYLKKHAKSRESWKSRDLSGFAITVLLAETYVLSPDRDDIALYLTMEAMKSRLDGNTVIDHPVIRKVRDGVRLRLSRVVRGSKSGASGCRNAAPGRFRCVVLGKCGTSCARRGFGRAEQGRGTGGEIAA